MIKCHLCHLETKHFNSLMTKHWKKHCSYTYSKEQYKVDILTNNGRPQKKCKICSKPTLIPKGEKEYPDYCKTCYLSKLVTQTGQDNNNWIGGKVEVTCTLCGEKRLSYSTQLEGQNAFCSSSCSTKFYCKEENMTEAKKKFFLQGRSIKENDCFELVKQLYPDAIPSYHIGYYNFDMFVPSNKILIEFDGTYWHSRPKAIIGDKRKTTYIAKYFPNLRLIRIPEKEWDMTINKLDYLKDKLYQESGI